MNKIRLLTFCFFALALPILASSASAKEEKEKEKEEKSTVKASIRPTGKLKKEELPALTKITFEDALKTARAAVPGAVIKAELEVEDGNLMYSFEIVGADKKTVEVEIDAGNGKVLDIDKD